MNKQRQNQIHIPVMLQEVLHFLQPAEGQSYLDVTAGFGGHAQAILERTEAAKAAVLVDRDEQAQKALRSKFATTGTQLIAQDFLSASKSLAQEGREFDMILADLGVSSQHLTNASRGFAFSQPGPLDMRMDQGQDLTAAKLVNTLPEKELAKILAEYGEEPKAAAVARRIVAARPLQTTDQLAQIAASAWPGHSRVHPATRTFQALRIAVNGELTQLEQSLPLWLQLLAPGGRLVVISFHSLEDRIVKNFLLENSGDRYDSTISLLTKKPVIATKDEIDSNPRARSAKLRAGSKNKKF
jgi:16S rRNA (cytosine1402-N4)-methyltransferase